MLLSDNPVIYNIVRDKYYDVIYPALRYNARFYTDEFSFIDGRKIIRASINYHGVKNNYDVSVDPIVFANHKESEFINNLLDDFCKRICNELWYKYSKNLQI